MGTWGPGNFDDDTSAEYIYEVVKPLLAQIEVSMQNKPTALQPDEFDGVVAICNIDIVSTLAEHLGRFDGEKQRKTSIVSLPSPETISNWREEYLKVWDERIDALRPSPQYKVLRRKVIKKTFDRLEKLARSQAEK